MQAFGRRQRHLHYVFRVQSKIENSFLLQIVGK